MKEHIEVYGPDNHLRLTGKHETAAITDFKFGVSDRGASIRIPIGTVEKGWKGWLEDRRPNSAADPYKVAARIIKTVKIAEANLAQVTPGERKLLNRRGLINIYSPNFRGKLLNRAYLLYLRPIKKEKKISCHYDSTLSTIYLLYRKCR